MQPLNPYIKHAVHRYQPMHPDLVPRENVKNDAKCFYIESKRTKRFECSGQGGEQPLPLKEKAVDGKAVEEEERASATSFAPQIQTNFRFKIHGVTDMHI